VTGSPGLGPGVRPREVNGFGAIKVFVYLVDDLFAEFLRC